MSAGLVKDIGFLRATISAWEGRKSSVEYEMGLS